MTLLGTRKTTAKARYPSNVKVEKDQFDALLKRLTKADPAKRQDIKTDEVKPGKIIPPTPKPQSDR